MIYLYIIDCFIHKYIPKICFPKCATYFKSVKHEIHSKYEKMMLFFSSKVIVVVLFLTIFVS